MRCHHCSGEICYAPVLVPKFPRGAFAFCSAQSCVQAAQRRARATFPRMAAARRAKPRGAAHGSPQPVS